jgi:hypothetical protein
MEFQYDNNCRDRGDVTNGSKALNGSECLLERHSVVKKTHEVIKVKVVNNNYVLCLSLHNFNHLNAELNPICHLLALLGDHHILHVSWIRVNATSSGHIKSNHIAGLDRP